MSDLLVCYVPTVLERRYPEVNRSILRFRTIDCHVLMKNVRSQVQIETKGTGSNIGEEDSKTRQGVTYGGTMAGLKSGEAR